MSNLKKRMLKIAGKKDFHLDEEIGFSYIIRQCWKYGWMMMRGILFAIPYKNISRDIFIGVKVRVIEKKRLHIGEKTKIHDGVYIDALSQEGVILGEHIVIGQDTRIECTGSLEYVGKGLKIGDRSTFGNDCYFGAAGGIEIGNDVVAGQYIRFHSENHTFDDLTHLIREQGVNHKGIKIGDNCWIGAGVVFLDGAELGDGCVVAANAVVNKKFENNSVIGGIPAKKIRVRGNQNV